MELERQAAEIDSFVRASEISSAAVDSTVESVVHADETMKRSPVAERK